MQVDPLVGFLDKQEKDKEMVVPSVNDWAIQQLWPILQRNEKEIAIVKQLLPKLKKIQVYLFLFSVLVCLAAPWDYLIGRLTLIENGVSAVDLEDKKKALFLIGGVSLFFISLVFMQVVTFAFWRSYKTAISEKRIESILLQRDLIFAWANSKIPEKNATKNHLIEYRTGLKSFCLQCQNVISSSIFQTNDGVLRLSEYGLKSLPENEALLVTDLLSLNVESITKAKKSIHRAFMEPF